MAAALLIALRALDLCKSDISGLDPGQTISWETGRRAKVECLRILDFVAIGGSRFDRILGRNAIRANRAGTQRRSF